MQEDDRSQRHHRPHTVTRMCLSPSPECSLPWEVTMECDDWVIFILVSRYQVIIGGAFFRPLSFYSAGQRAVQLATVNSRLELHTSRSRLFFPSGKAAAGDSDRCVKLVALAVEVCFPLGSRQILRSDKQHN